MPRRVNLFSDPRTWGREMIGTPLRYRIAQGVGVVAALNIVMAFFRASKYATHDGGWWIDFGLICAWMLVGLILWPLSLLRALRAWVPPLDDSRRSTFVSKKDAGDGR